MTDILSADRCPADGADLSRLSDDELRSASLMCSEIHGAMRAMRRARRCSDTHTARAAEGAAERVRERLARLIAGEPEPAPKPLIDLWG